MKGTHSFGKRLLAMLLCVAMVASYLPGMALSASAQTKADKVVDPSTMDDWQNFFGPNKLSTEFAGGVWTDKSVFTDASAFSGVTLDDPNSFLVALSAISSNKQVDGKSTSPTDTMLVLDLSNSMDTIRAIPDMVSAANATIDKLLGMNAYNRVGVVLYSGNSTQGNASANTATVILPLGQYKPNADKEYLDYTGSSSNTTVIRAQGMTYVTGTADSQTASKQTNGATYIQNGLYKAWQEFDKVTDTTVTSGAMTGTKRTPIYILMSDGEPTVATTSYYNVGQSGVGNGTSPSNQTTRNQLTFLTQLTASYVKGKAEAKYGTDAKFYTLGLGISENESATAVLSPSSTNQTVSGWWSNFLAGTANQNVTIYGNNYNRWSLYRDAAVTEQNYVDRYWSADKASELPNIFNQIATEIEVASAYSATLVTTNDYNMDGYITFEDEIGELMEVKDVKGIWLGGTLFSGAELAKSMNAGTLGDATNGFTALGDELVRTVKERIGITETSVAQQLINSAYLAGQLSYTSDTQYSNYIGWYADKDNNFLGFWRESFGTDGLGEEAKYINKSYGYLGGVSSDPDAADMMHVVVQVRTEIATSHQDVLFKIPASLIPAVTYKVQLDGDKIEDATALTREGAEPMRLLFEVGLRSDINALNLEEKVAQYLAESEAHHVHKNADGTYTFYTNSWGHGDGDQSPAYNTDLIPYVAESHFHPSYQNERYYYTEDTAIYVKNGESWTLYTGDQQPTGSDYYHRRTVVTAKTNGGAAAVEYIFAPIASATLATADNVKKVGDTWYVKAGVAYTETARFDILKGGDANGDNQADNNATKTLEYANFPMVVHDAAGFNIYAILGNNGKITLTPAQGIKLSKTVTETVENAPTEFEFTVTFDAVIASDEIKLRDVNGDAFTGNYSVASASGKTVVTVTLTNGQAVYIVGIPTDTAYEVHETQTVYYNSDHENDTVTGTVKLHHIDDVVFTNAPRQPGHLTITKTVNHPFGGRPAALDNIEFTVELDLGQQAAGMSFKFADGTDTPVADENGVITLKIKAEQSITIQGILEDTPYEVREVNVPQGFQWDQAASSGLTGRVSGAAHLVNNYVPTPPVSNPGVDIVVNKTLTGDYTEAETFTFLVEKLNPDTGLYEILGAKTINVAHPTTATGSVSLADIVAGFTSLGSHTFRITEATGSTVGMTYSNQIAAFRIDVVDPQMDGTLEIQVVDLLNTTVTKGADTYTVTTNFTNVYAVGSTYVDVNIHKTLVNETGVDISLTGFQFGLYTDPACTQLAQIIDGEHLTVYAGALGNAVIRIPVTNISQNGTVYYIKEIVPDTKIPGMTYSDAIYKVTLQVEAVQQSGNAVLTANAVITVLSGTGSVDGNTVSFTNRYALKETAAVIQGNKSYIRGYDRQALPMAAGDFTFQLWTANADYTVNTLLGTVTNNADGTFKFENLDALKYSKVGSYAYILREAPGNNSAITYDLLDYYVLVLVTAEGDSLKAEVRYRQEGASAAADRAAFTNIYNVSGTAQTVVQGNKQLNVIKGQKVLAGGEFTFGLYDSEGKELDTANNRANGSFLFDTITYTAADVGKTFTYTVREIPPANATLNGGKYTLDGVTYSNASFQVKVEIKDNGDGTISAVQTLVGADSITFVNDYEAKPVSHTISGEKQLSGRDLAAGEFEFALYKTGADFMAQGDPIQTVKNAADGSFSFDALSYDAVGDYYYVVREQIPAVDAADRLGGVSYDAGIYQISVQVFDGGAGQLIKQVRVYRPGSANDTVLFHNTYKPAPATVQLEAQKTYDKPLKGDDFKFVLKGSIGETVVSQEKTNDAAGKVVFDTLTFDTVGVYTFTVTEKDEFFLLPWIEFDKAVYTVTVTVTDNGAGQLETAVKYATESGDSQSISFKNTYKIIEDAQVQLGGNKYYLGDELSAGQFLFGLYSDANCTQQIGQSVTNDVQSVDLGKFVFPTIKYENIHIDDLPATYTYYIREILPEGVQAVDDGNGGTDYVLNGVHYDTKVYKVEVVLTDNGTGGVDVKTLVDGIENDEIAFTNSYDIVSGTKVVLSGNKIVHNKAIEAGKYTFGLFEEGAASPKFTATNLADGTFTFDALEFDANTPVGTVYKYTVKEIIPNGAVNNVFEGITYDTTVYNIKVEITHNGTNGLQSIVSITGGGTNNAIIFNNYYNITGSAETTITGQKVYNNANGSAMTIGAGDFIFGLYQNNTLIATTETKAGGAFVFENLQTLTYGPGDVGKTFTYEVREIAGQAGYITYDETIYTVVVKVTDNGKGGIALTKTVNGGENTPIAFTNVYTNTGKDSLILGGNKKFFDTRLQKYYTYLPASLFTFVLTDENGGELQQVSNLADGTFTFQALEYTAEDIGKEFIYYITERNDGLSYIGYDDAKYKVVVTVKDNGQGGITVEKTVNGAADTQVTFENTYKVSGTAQLVLGGMKLYTNNLTGQLKDLPAGTFQFNITGPKVNETVSNKLGGDFSFSAITYGVEDIGNTYEYTVSEVQGSLNYVAYDKDVYTVRVTVSDNGQGGIALDKVITANGSETATIAFDNYYDVVTPGSVELGGTKNYIDSRTGSKKTMEAGMFTFQLTGHGLNLTAVNDAQGNFLFDAIHYDRNDVGHEYTYTITEVKGDKDYITYDTAISYQVKVKIADNGQGGLDIVKTVIGGGEIVFTNYYNVVNGGSVELNGIKTYKDGRTGQAKPITAGMFKFRISGNGIDETVSVAADGSFRFSALTYTAADIGNTYSYIIEEVGGNKAYITNDTTKYTLDVTVEDDGNGGLKITKKLNGTATDTVHVAFENTYNIIQGGEVAISGTKTYTDSRTQAALEIPAGLFSFKITGTDGYTETVTNAAGGRFTFQNLKFDTADIGHIYTYTIEEVKGDKGYITYDSKKHTLVVSVTDNGVGGLSITKILDGTITDTVNVSFENAYNIISGGSVEITGTKNYEGRTLAGEDFTFILSKDGKELQRVRNAANGSFSFTAIEYTKKDIGTHIYKVEELRPEDAQKNKDGLYQKDGVIYDANVYTVTVVVEDNGEGGLKISKQVNNSPVEKIHVLFDNKYQISGMGVLELTGTKTLTGRPMKDGEFTFGLYLDGKQVNTAVNKDGVFTLTETYGVEDLGEYTYTVSEVKGSEAYVVYDGTVYTVKVKVYDDGKGGIAVDWKLQGAQNIQFKNVYAPPASPETADSFSITTFFCLMILSSFGLAAVMIRKKQDEAKENAE